MPKNDFRNIVVKLLSKSTVLRVDNNKQLVNDWKCSLSNIDSLGAEDICFELTLGGKKKIKHLFKKKDLLEAGLNGNTISLYNTKGEVVRIECYTLNQVLWS